MSVGKKYCKFSRCLNTARRANIIIQSAFRKPAKRVVIPPKCSNHLRDCKKGGSLSTKRFLGEKGKDGKGSLEDVKTFT